MVSLGRRLSLCQETFIILSKFTFFLPPRADLVTHLAAAGPRWLTHLPTHTWGREPGQGLDTPWAERPALSRPGQLPPHGLMSPHERGANQRGHRPRQVPGSHLLQQTSGMQEPRLRTCPRCQPSPGLGSHPCCHLSHPIAFDTPLPLKGRRGRMGRERKEAPAAGHFLQGWP